LIFDNVFSDTKETSVKSSKQPGAPGKDSRASGRPHTPDRNLSIQPSMEEIGDERSDFVAEASNAAASLSDDLKAAARTMTRAVKDQAADFASGVGQELGKTAESQKIKGVETIHGFARAITSAADELEGQSPGVARSIRTAAQKVESFSNNLNGRSVDELLKASGDFAKSQPLLFVGMSVAAGFALARFLKSSADTPSPASKDAGTLVGS
jgi:hypothetical protein